VLLRGPDEILAHRAVAIAQAGVQRLFALLDDARVVLELCIVQQRPHGPDRSSADLAIRGAETRVTVGMIAIVEQAAVAPLEAGGERGVDRTNALEQKIDRLDRMGAIDADDAQRRILRARPGDERERLFVVPEVV